MSHVNTVLGPQATDLTKQVFAQFPTGVVVLSALVDDRPRAMLISAFTVGVSLEPPLVSAAVARTSTTWPHLRAARLLGVSVLAEDQGSFLRDLAGRDRAAAWMARRPPWRSRSLPSIQRVITNWWCWRSTARWWIGHAGRWSTTGLRAIPSEILIPPADSSPTRNSEHPL